jgi:hypothetical protein
LGKTFSGPHSQSGRFGDKKKRSFLAVIESRFLNRSAHSLANPHKTTTAYIWLVQQLILDRMNIPLFLVYETMFDQLHSLRHNDDDCICNTWLAAITRGFRH